VNPTAHDGALPPDPDGAGEPPAASPGAVGDGPGWAGAAVLFAAGIALGAIVTGSPVQERVPFGPPGTRAGGPAPPPLVELSPLLGPGLVPFYTAALSFPFFLWLARRSTVTRASWRRTVPLWAAAVVAVAVAGDALLLAALGAGGGAGPQPLHFLVRRFVTTAPLVLGSVALAHAVEQRRRARAAALEAERARAELAVARLNALAAQLRPHFLFNTLQTVSTLLHCDPESADAVLGKLGELLHASLRFDRRPVIPLEEELRITDAYLAIARERFGPRLRATVAVGPGAEDALVPPFLLQPLVENAVQHGIEPVPAGGRVDVRVDAEGGMLVLRVTDTGAGEAAGEAEGVGLGNTRRRLQALYGARAALSVESRPGSGTRVTVRFPAALPAAEAPG
jgi:two-component system, LytTR family, sensor kinase